MTTTAPPSLFGDTRRPTTADTATPSPHGLVDLLYDGFYMVFLLKNRKAPSDADRFTTQIQKFLADFERRAQKRHFAPEDIFDAKYAFCATVDEAILSSRLSIRDAWERRPLQLTLFGDQLAGEHFFDKLETARNGGARRIDALEVFQMCLLIGFQGKYLLEGPEKLAYLTAQLGEQITHIKGKRGGFAPHWEIPDRVAHALKRELPVWALASILALGGLIGYLGLRYVLDGATRKTLAPYAGIVQLAPRAPTLTITLP
ncbi:DotU family type IV/VI secretion system protein [Nitrogeniibacter mangrovi]|uniref:DotU family type IV/VI secretion system protein n=1 Tax=Nitrogeniibacter mangrovi TaxID=2016596 RepID=A0A6C1B1K4_9RHOO|nr:type IVB secretion system protein IcmH/DotU [Nitrogeniibacter mangrovi]QID17447.1 DotU family type IV/VI secretion system protein [Nitrogeniibacter mangrovi]